MSETISPVVMDESTTTEVQKLENLTKIVVVTNPQERELIYNEIKKVKGLKARIVDFFKPSKESAWETHKKIVANEQSFTSRLDAFEVAGKLAIQKYDAVEEVKRAAEERRLQAIADEQARKEREKQESAARLLREKENAARLAEEEARKRAEAAKQAQIDAERKEREATTAKARQQAQEAAERARKKQVEAAKVAESERLRAESAKAKAEVKDEQAAAVVASVVQVASVAAKQAGESTTKKWTYRIIDETLIPREYLCPNEKALQGMATGTKGLVKIPGVEFYYDEIMNIRK
jgi:hypothetical protein